MRIRLHQNIRRNNRIEISADALNAQGQTAQSILQIFYVQPVHRTFFSTKTVYSCMSVPICKGNLLTSER